jgi:hypothetical protein
VLVSLVYVSLWLQPRFRAASVEQRLQRIKEHVGDP